MRDRPVTKLTIQGVTFSDCTVGIGLPAFGAELDLQGSSFSDCGKAIVVGAQPPVKPPSWREALVGAAGNLAADGFKALLLAGAAFFTLR